MKWKLLLLVGGMLTGGFCKGQGKASIPDVNQHRSMIESGGMMVLGTWAAGNMVWAGIGAASKKGKTKAFHQMNLYWNSVNLVIAGLGYINAKKSREPIGLWESMKAQQKSEKILLVNAALDFGYMATGMYLKERGKRLESEQLHGFGNSVILQGAFLMVFDGILYALQSKNGKKFEPWIQNLDLSTSGLGIKATF
ncbi:DUF6992 family protein [Cyclobacterium jeungdonense]|uniref:Uncharacterized protein n=1 Tax=Cyclobacterium jeungdonense TaxID=708087 RepID=A0ABT8C3V2_9BACT|nr:hypothetical protein [Cyclobacterium jeungdonense]MDN3686767.1 hypothetical protein [Cyclobacterium jeungdonense]